MRQVFISRVACETALGSGPELLWQRLLEGRSAITSLQRFSSENYLSSYAACINDLSAPVGFSLLDTLLERVAEQLGEVPADTRLLLATTKGEIDLLEEVSKSGGRLPRSVLFEPLLDKVARRFGLTDAGLNINAACASSTIALARGAAMIASGQVESVLVYAVDIVSEFVFSGFSALQALSAEPCRPFDRERLGLTLGEAGVALLLTSEDRMRTLDQAPLVRISGWGAANDAHHVTAPARDGCGLLLACRAAIKQAGISVNDIAAISAHGTGTLYNDAMEVTAFNTLFAAEPPPMHGIKGSLGHCLGAAGGIEALVSGYALQQQRIPGTIGCEQPEADCLGWVSATSQNICGEYLLSTNSGFGGINAALVLQGVTA